MHQKHIKSFLIISIWVNRAICKFL